MEWNRDVEMPISSQEGIFDGWKSKPQDLYAAAMEGDWETAKKIIDSDPRMRTARINVEGMTALHVAANCGKTQFVVELVRILTAEELEVKDQVGRNALHHVALACQVKAAKEIVEKNPSLAKDKEAFRFTPLFYAARWRPPSENNSMLNFLYQVTPIEAYIDPETGASLIVAITTSGSHDIALKILRQHPRFIIEQSLSGWTILQVLAAQPSKYLSGDYKIPLWKRFIYPWKRSYYAKQHEKHKDALELIHTVCEQLRNLSFPEVMEYFLPEGYPVLHLATEHGLVELVKVCLKYFPDLIWYTSAGDGKQLLQVAIEHRQSKIFNHLLELIGETAGAYAGTMVGNDKNNMLHVAAKLAPAHQLHSVPGPAFQMQSELEWFQAVDALVYRDERFAKNSKNLTPLELFYEEHQKLMEDAKEWMKETSNSCMVVAALVATVAFAAMITVPGGNNDTGLPILSRQRLFVIFSIANALSMIFSALALLMFLSLQTSRFSKEDFLKSLPSNLIIGLLSLFVAVVTMMVAFGTAVGLSLQRRFKWAYIPITIVACMPAFLFTKLQLPLLFQAVTPTGPVIHEQEKLEYDASVKLAMCGLNSNRLV